MATSTAVTVIVPHAVNLPEPTGLPPRMADVFTRAMREVSTLIDSEAFQSRFAQVVLTMLRTNTTLQQCTPDSIITSLVEMCFHNFDPSSANECFLIPYQGKATLQVGYAGLMKLALSHPDVLDIYAEEVCENDTYEYYGVNVLPKHVYPAKFAPRGRYLGYYAVAILSQQRVRAVQMSVDEIKAHAKHYSQNAQNKIWSEDRGGAFRSMALKTVLRKICSTRYIPVAGKVATLLHTMETIEGTIDAERDEQRSQQRRTLEAGNTVADHIEHLTGERPKNDGAIYSHAAPLPPVREHAPKQYTVTPQGTTSTQSSPHFQEGTPLALEVQITDFLYAQGKDDAGVAAWWQELQTKHSDLSPGYLNYVFEQLQGKPADSLERVPRPPRGQAQLTPVDAISSAWAALEQAQARLEWTEQEKRTWERKQARRFRKTYSELPLDTIRGLAEELEALAAKTSPSPASTPQSTAVVDAQPAPPVPSSESVSAFHLPEDEDDEPALPGMGQSTEYPETSTFPDFATIRDELVWWAQSLQDLMLKEEVEALLADAETPEDVLVAKRTEVQQRIEQERVAAEGTLPF